MIPPPFARAVRRAYHAFVDQIKKLQSYSGKPMTSFVTPAGVSVVVADEIPRAALVAWRNRLAQDLGEQQLTPEGSPHDPARTAGEGFNSEM